MYSGALKVIQYSSLLESGTQKVIHNHILFYIAWSNEKASVSFYLWDLLYLARSGQYHHESAERITKGYQAKGRSFIVKKMAKRNIVQPYIFSGIIEQLGSRR